MIRYANISDFELLRKHDAYISDNELQNSIKQYRVLVMFDDDEFSGWLRYNLFWDNILFMNILYFSEENRQKGYGRQLTEFWENEMYRKNYSFVLTSSQSDEEAQFFYRKIGYTECGSLLLPNTPLEIIFIKYLQK